MVFCAIKIEKEPWKANILLNNDKIDIVNKPKHSCISSQPRNGNANVFIDGNNLLLVCRELTDRPFQCNKHSKLFVFQTDGGGTQLHCLHCILHLVETTLGAPYCDVTVVLVSELK